MLPSSKHVWALVSGFASPLRENRSLLMLQAFVDDSGTHGPPVAVLAGYVAPAEAWARFSDEWHAQLLSEPRIDYLKMAEAVACRGQFDGWRYDDRDHKLRELIKIIARHAVFSISSTIRYADFDELVRGKMAVGSTTPYMWLFLGAIQSITILRMMFNIVPEPVDFIFDEQPGERTRALKGWDALRAAIPDPSVLEMIGSTPIFRDDKKVLPLQAADLIAWRTRRRFCEGGKRFSANDPIWRPLDKIAMSANDWERWRIVDVMEQFNALQAGV